MGEDKMMMVDVNGEEGKESVENLELVGVWNEGKVHNGRRG